MYILDCSYLIVYIVSPSVFSLNNLKLLIVLAEKNILMTKILIIILQLTFYVGLALQLTSFQTTWPLGVRLFGLEIYTASLIVYINM